MKTRWKILIAAGIFLLLAVASAWLTAHHQPQNAVEDYKKFLRDHGEKLEISEVLPPKISSASNSVNAVQDAFRLLGSGSEKIPNAMKMVAPGKALIGWSQPDARNSDFTNSWDELAAEIEVSRPVIELLHQILERPKLDFELDYTKGFALVMSHLAPMKRVTQKLNTAAICDLHNGDTGAATTNILTMLALVQRNEGEGFVISHLVRIAISAIAVVPTWELLQATNVTDAQLAAVQNGWEQMDFLSDAKAVFLMERAWMLQTIQKSRASHEEFVKTLGAAASGSRTGGSASAGTWPPDWKELTEKPRLAVAEVMWRSSWSYADELRTLQGQQIILETLRTMQTNQSQFYKMDYDAMETRFASLGITNVGEAFFRALQIPDFREEFGAQSLNGIVLRTMRIEAARRVIISAIALKRFQLKHGQWPATLDELAPEFLSSIPIDPYDGKPLRYHPNADGTYLLYGVGEDGVDDGGDPTNTASGSSNLYWQNTRARDWVWPQPATPAEVQFFYDHPPK
jgi:hypothetical protein